VDVADEQELRLWRIDELRRLRFNESQRRELLKRIEAGEITLAEIRDLIEKRHWTPEQAFLSAA
jgi:hypothetical protein